MKPRTLIDTDLFKLIIRRLCHQLIENHDDFSECVLIGLQPRGVVLKDALVRELISVTGNKKIVHGSVDPTFYRDDFRTSEKPLVARPTEIPFSLEQKNVVLIDDVFYTGRTVRAGMEALMEHGRPGNIELLVLIDRRFSREIPIMPNYIGKSVDSYDNQKVLVSWNPDGTENAVYLLTDKQ